MLKKLNVYSVLVLLLVVVAGAGCGVSAMQREVKTANAEMKKLRRELRKTTSRVEELSNQVFILQDRVDSNRMQLKRRPKAYAEGGGKEGRSKGQGSKKEGSKAVAQAARGSGHATNEGGASGDRRTGGGGEEGASEDPEDAGDSEPPRRLKVVRLRPGARRRHSRARRGSRRGERRGKRRRVIKLDQRSLGRGEGSVPTHVSIKEPRLPVVPVPSPSGGIPASGPIQRYRAAYSLYLKGKYTQAQKRFHAFARSYPNHDYADNAVFWKGQCLYRSKKYAAAAGVFRQVLKRYPSGNKAPDALLKLGMSYSRLGRKSQARTVLVQVVEIYPNTRVARLAAGALRKLRP